MRVQITKPQRRRIAEALAKVVADVFGVPVSVVALADEGYNASDTYRTQTITVLTSAGITRLTIDVCPRLVSVFTQFIGPITDAQRGMAVRMSGNQYSGKINFHSAPSGKASEQWCEDVATDYAHVAHAMLRDR